MAATAASTPDWYAVPEEGLRAGDVGVIVEHHPARADVPAGYELEVFAANGQTIAVVSVPASAVREATEREVLSVRELARPGDCPSIVPLLAATEAKLVLIGFLLSWVQFRVE